MINAPHILNPNVRAALALCSTHETTCMCKECTAIFDLASEHRYECKCAICAFWWKRVGEEDDE